MRSLISLFLGASALAVVPALAQTPGSSGPADLCQELLAYAEQKASAPAGQQENKPPPQRSNSEGSGTQGGGSVSSDSSSDTSEQASAPPTSPATSGAAPEAATSPHANASAGGSEAESSGDFDVQQLQAISQRGDRKACREVTQKMRRAGAELPAALITLAAYDPDRRQ